MFRKGRHWQWLPIDPDVRIELRILFRELAPELDDHVFVVEVELWVSQHQRERKRKDPKKPHGKLRLLYEANPLAFVAEQAGGAASTGTRRILEVLPESLHQRVPLFVGSADDVAEAEAFLRGGR